MIDYLPEWGVCEMTGVVTVAFWWPPGGLSCASSLCAPSQEEADEGVGRRPGGLPHQRHLVIIVQLFIGHHIRKSRPARPRLSPWPSARPPHPLPGTAPSALFPNPRGH